MANRSREKSDKRRAVEDGLHQLQATDHQIEEQIMKTVELWNQLDWSAQERSISSKIRLQTWRKRTNPRPRHTEVILSRVLYEFV
jgi:hypothetical protein